MAGDSITRRVFLGYSAVTPLILEDIAFGQTKEDALWENARKNPADGQKALDETHKKSSIAQKYVSRFYSLFVAEKKGTTTDKWALVSGDKQLRCYDTNLEKNVREELKKFSDSYTKIKAEMDAKASGGKPVVTKDDVERAFHFMTAELIDRVENKAQIGPDIARNQGADVYLPFLLWGTGMQSIGFGTKPFFENTICKTAEDYKSYLLDYATFGKAADQFNNPRIEEIWIGNKLNFNIADLWTKGFPGKKDAFTAVLKNRWANFQAGEIANKVRGVSDDYTKEMANAWENSVEFRYLVKLHLEYSTHESRDPEVRESLSNCMGKLWGCAYLPVDGKIVKYDPVLVKQYNFENK